MTDTAWAALVCAIFAGAFGRAAADDLLVYRIGRDWRFGLMAVVMTLFSMFAACTAVWLLLR